MKVYQYPPRRGNGSYWTLLTDGEDELKRAIPLFSTFQPPLIDPESAYNRTPSTHTVRSRGQFVPVLPRSDKNATNQPYFSVNVCNSFINLIPQHDEVIVEQSLKDNASYKKLESDGKTNTGIPKHLLDHSYTKQLHSTLEAQSLKANDCSMSTIDFPSSEEIFTPKRKKVVSASMKKKSRYSKSRHIANKENWHRYSVCQPSAAFTATTPSKENDISFGFLDSSLLTPLKDIVNDIEIGGPGGISLSPLYANFVSPQNVTPKRPGSKIIPSPVTPFSDPSMDSGIFTPFQLSTSLRSPNRQCSTPLKLFSPIPNLMPGFGTPHEDFFSSLKVSSEILDSSIKIGSLQALGLSGLTPPTLSSLSPY